MARGGRRRGAGLRVRGFTLVELMIVVAIIGVLAALAIYGVSKYLAASKTAEAKNSVGAIARAAVSEFVREHVASEVLSPGGLSKQVSYNLCGAAERVPSDAAKVSGKKYLPNNTPSSDFGKGDMNIGWPCLGFTMSEPIHYRYGYEVNGNYVTDGLPDAPAIGAEGFEASAQGDLDGDGSLSTFARAGKIEGKTINLATQLYIHDDLE